MIEPHGGTIVDRTVSGERAAEIERTADDGPAIRLDREQYQEVLNVACGRLSPLEGFMSRNDFLKVVNDMTLEDGTVWSLPVVLDVSADVAGRISPSDRATLRGPEGELVGVVDVDEVYRYNATDAARRLFGTTDREHPGVRKFLDREDFLVGGDVRVVEEPRSGPNDLLPRESRVLFAEAGWETVVGFQTRNAPHRAHEYIQKSALELVDGLLVQPKIGHKKPGDYDDETILGAYRTLIDHYYPDDCVALSVFPSKMRYAGPREAVFDAIVRKNQGCSHFVVGRDHAGVKDFYDGFDAQRIFDEVADIGISPLFFSYAFYCEPCDGMVSEKICPHDDDSRVHPSGTRIRELLRGGDRPSPKMMRPEVADYITDRRTPFVTGGDGR
jgi:sulfate adenylyltransferase